MPWYWYYRDKPLKQHPDVVFAGFTPSGIIEYKMEACLERGLDCRSTCCLETDCAEDLSQCSYYIRRSYFELYICVAVVLMIVVGVPTAIKTMEFLLMFKFCRKFDEDENAYVGGMTVCECLATCCSAKKPVAETHEKVVEELVMEADDVIDDEYADS